MNIKESADLYFRSIIEKFPFLRKTIECGRHSGIPDCCIINYIMHPDLDTNENSLLLEDLFRLKSGIHYRACISCLLKGERKILKLCNCFNYNPDCSKQDYWGCASINCKSDYPNNIVTIYNSLCKGCSNKER